MNITYTLSELQKIGMTQKQIGAAIGVAQPTVSDMARGGSGITRPSYKVITGLELLAKEHGITTEPPAPPKRRKADQATPP